MLNVRTQTLGDVAILCLQGRVVIGETDKLSEAVRSQSNASMLVLDFAQVELIDARGLGVLLELGEFTRSHGTEFRLVNVNKLVQQVLKITRLNSVFETSLDEKPGAVLSGQLETILHASCFLEA
jgi:anti-anti-sigma factor